MPNTHAHRICTGIIFGYGQFSELRNIQEHNSARVSRKLIDLVRVSVP